MKSSLRFRYDTFPFPFYAVLVSHRGKRIQEEYVSPAAKERLHRMFSVTKSFTALAVIALAAEGKLSLSDPIIRYFPDYTPADPHPYLTAMTVQDMLDMKTCHKATTYKINPKEHWVRSFFVTPPDHRSGQIFKYDTGAAHTLAALVKRISGNGVLDYLRGIYLDAIGFSPEAHILKDPFGDEIGGSGLLAAPEDLMRAAEFLMALYQGDWQNRYGFLIREPYDEAFYERYAELFRSCVSLRSPTVHEGKTLDECQGYGSQFWRMRNGFMMYGMGGQYAAFFPKEDLIIVTAADAQPLQGACQIILDEIQRIDAVLRSEAGRPSGPVSAPMRPEGFGEREALAQTIASLKGTWKFTENRNGFLSCSISDDEVTLEHRNGTFRFPIGPDGEAETTDSVYSQKLYVHTSALQDGSLYQYAEIYDDYLGSIRILLHGGDEALTVYLRKAEESLFPEFDGFLEAVRAE